MTTLIQTELRSVNELVALIEQLPQGVDPAFDHNLDELEREFAALRLTFANN